MEDFGCSSHEDSILPPFVSMCQSRELLSVQQLPRVSTAPSRPLTDLQQFKHSKSFLSLQQAIVCSNHLVHKAYDKLDLDSDEGQSACQKYLNSLQKMIEAYEVDIVDRKYRESFTQAYKVLYKEGSLSYLTQILDSAQEGFPYLWVNSQKYEFSQEVLESGQKLMLLFSNLLNNLRSQYGKLTQHLYEPDTCSIQIQIRAELQEFDVTWSSFEKRYVLELMQIQIQARRLILEAIQIEKELHSVEIRQRLKGKILINCEDYMNTRKNLCAVINQINQVSNYCGNGRELEHQILCEAEGILRRVSREQSKAIRVLAQKIRTTFNNIRILLRKYEKNIEMVDPQLKNNSQLVEALAEYEKAWEKGQDYFLYPQKKKFLVHFSGIIQSLSEKYQRFSELMQCSDADLFLMIPCILVLRYLDNDDKHICLYFLPNLQQIQTKTFRMYFQLEKEFEEWKKCASEHYCYYNILQKLILGVELQGSEKEKYDSKQGMVDKMMYKIKNLAMELHRAHPAEWNLFLEISLAGAAP